MPRAYIAGPMRGLPNFNFARFDEAAERWREAGYGVVNPADHDRQVYPDIAEWPGFAKGDPAKCPEFDLRAALLWDLNEISTCDVLVLLPGYSTSSGARCEVAFAEALGITVRFDVESVRLTPDDPDSPVRPRVVA